MCSFCNRVLLSTFHFDRLPTFLSEAPTTSIPFTDRIDPTTCSSSPFDFNERKSTARQIINQFKGTHRFDLSLVAKKRRRYIVSFVAESDTEQLDGRFILRCSIGHLLL